MITTEDIGEGFISPRAGQVSPNPHVPPHLELFPLQTITIIPQKIITMTTSRQPPPRTFTSWIHMR